MIFSSSTKHAPTTLPQATFVTSRGIIQSSSHQESCSSSTRDRSYTHMRTFISQWDMVSSTKYKIHIRQLEELPCEEALGWKQPVSLVTILGHSFCSSPQRTAFREVQSRPSSSDTYSSFIFPPSPDAIYQSGIIFTISSVA